MGTFGRIFWALVAGYGVLAAMGYFTPNYTMNEGFMAIAALIGIAVMDIAAELEKHHDDNDL